MSARIVLIHDDAIFSKDLTTQLRLQGHVLSVFDDLMVAIPLPRASNILELAIVPVLPM